MLETTNLKSFAASDSATVAGRPSQPEGRPAVILCERNRLRIQNAERLEMLAAIERERNLGPITWFKTPAPQPRVYADSLNLMLEGKRNRLKLTSRKAHWKECTQLEKEIAELESFLLRGKQ